MSACYCGQAAPFSQCCEPLIKGEREAASPEQLMRSRYSAYAVKDIDYVLATTDPQGRHDMDLEASREWAETSEFTKLEVLKSTDEGNKGTVEFKAHFRDKDGKAHIHHELSKFRKQGGKWYFRDGRVVPAPNPS